MSEEKIEVEIEGETEIEIVDDRPEADRNATGTYRDWETDRKSVV